MKILLVHNFYKERGGEDVVVEGEAEMLRRNGHAVTTFFVSNSSIGNSMAALGAAIGSVYNFGARNALRSKIEDIQPDLVHIHNTFPLLSPSVFDACSAAGVPVIATLHNFRILCPTSTLTFNGVVDERSLRDGAWWAIPRKVYRDSLIGTAFLAANIEFHKAAGTWNTKVTRLIALTEFAKRKFAEGGIYPDHICIKGNTVYGDPPPAPDEDAERNGALFVGRLSPEKGISVLMDAWDSLEIPLTILGDGPLRSLVGSEQNSRVHLAGHRPAEEVRAKMRAAEFLVISSTCYEMFPLVVVEAFASGLPVISPDLGGPAEIVEEGVTGLHYTTADPVDLSQKVRWAAAHPEEMRFFGRNARQRYLERHSPAANYAQLMCIYEASLGNKLWAAA